MTIQKQRIISIIIAVLLEFCVLLGIIFFQQSVLMSFPLLFRAFLMIALQWLLLIVPIVFMRKAKESLFQIGFSKSNIPSQVLTGVIIGLAMSLILTVLPILIGLKEMIGSTTYTQPWQFYYQFAYMILGVAFVEEFFYRGFLFHRLFEMNQSKWFAIIVSSVLFGLSHLFHGNIIQVIITSILGIFLCLCREKLKHCSTLSLILAHGLHNALITLFVAIL